MFCTKKQQNAKMFVTEEGCFNFIIIYQNSENHSYGILNKYQSLLYSCLKLRRLAAAESFPFCYYYEDSE